MPTITDSDNRASGPSRVTWHRLSRDILRALVGSPFEVETDRGRGFIRSSLQGPRAGERMRLVEFIKTAEDELAVAVVLPEGPEWPTRTARRVMPALMSLDHDLATAEGQIQANQPHTFLQAMLAAQAAIPRPQHAGRSKKREHSKSIHTVSGGLPTLGKRH